MKLGLLKKGLTAAAFLAGIGSIFPHFASVHAKDADPPLVVATNPASSSVEVSVTDSVYVYFSENVQPGPAFSSIVLSSEAGPASVTASVQDDELIIVPDQPLAHAATYLLDIPHDAVRSLSGIPLQHAFSLSFTTVSAPLLFTTSNPAPGAVSVPVNQEISIVFNQEIYEGQNFTGIVLQRDGPSQSVAASVYGNKLQLMPIPELDPSVTYAVYVPEGAVESAAQVPNTPLHFQFTTEAVDNPSAIDTYEPNDTPDAAYAIDAGIAYNSYISQGADIDYYVIHASKSATMQFELTVPPGNRYLLSLFDGTGALLASGSERSEQKIDYPVEIGRSYLIRISGTDDADYGDTPYTLTAAYRVDTPQHLRVESHIGSEAILAWNPVDEQWGVVNYDLYQDGQWLLSTGQTTVQLHNLAGGATVQYTVSARNGSDLDSTPSEAVTLLLFGDDTEPPSKPTLELSATDWTNQNVTVTIISGADAYSGIWKSEYKIGDEDAWTEYESPITVASEGETRVFARTIDNVGNISEEASAVVKIDRTPPTAPDRLYKTQTGGTEITIGWSESADNVGVVGYQIFNDGILLGDTEDLRANMTGLLPASFYRLTVRAFDAAGNYSDFSHELRMSTYRQPAYVYDPQGTGRLIRIQYEDDTAVTFQYDVNGNLIRTMMQP